MFLRRSFKQIPSFKKRLSEQAAGREEAKALPPGRDREELLLKIRPTKAAARLDQWTAS